MNEGVHIRDCCETRRMFETRQLLSLYQEEVYKVQLLVVCVINV